MTRENIAASVADLCKRCGVQHQAVAEAVGMTPQHYRRLVLGETPLSTANTIALRSVYYMIESLQVQGKFRDPMYATPRVVKEINTEIFRTAWVQYGAA